MAGSSNRTVRRARLLFSQFVVVILAAAGCREADPPRQYPLTGQVLAVHAERQELTVKHEDIPNFMPAMTMTYPVAPALLEGRKPGELIAATLEVRDSTGRLIDIRSTGSAPLPSESEIAMASNPLAEGDEVPDVALIDQSNRRRSFSEWRGSLTLVTFIYTSCPIANFCPLMDQNFATLQEAIAEDPLLEGQVRLVSVSFDPDTDTPEVLAKHAARRRADPAVWTYLTGDRVTVQRFAGRFGVSVLEADGATDITHNLRTALIGRDGRIVRFYSGNDWTPSTVLADLRAARARP
jgi:protein SCO1/2